MSIYVAGASGRLGEEIVRRAAAAGLSVAGEAEARVCLLALPREVVSRDRERWLGSAATVVDLSGAFKQEGRATYGLLRGGRAWHGQPLTAGGKYANPGCMAACVILGLERSGVLAADPSPLHITLVASRSAAHRSQSGTLRLGRRAWDHPHVAEIEAALAGVELASFTPIVDFALERGVLAHISGSVTKDAALAGRTDELELANVIDTPEHALALRLGPAPLRGPGGRRAFSLTCAIDNLTFPAQNAVEIARACGG